MPASTLQQFQGDNSIKTPLKYFAGLILVGILIVVLIVAGILGDKEKSASLSSPDFEESWVSN